MDSFQDLKDKYMFHSQKQIERAKKANRPSRFIDIAEKSNIKLLALKKVLKIKMDEKKKEKYEKRLLMYKIANEDEEADYEKFFDENESECELNEDQNSQSQESKVKQDETNSEENNTNSQEQDDNSRSSENDEKSIDEENSQSMDCNQNDLINQNRDLLTKMIYNNQQSQQMDNEDLLDLCSAKVVSNDFIDDECEDDDSMQDNRFDDSENDDEESQLNDEESQLNGEESQLNEEKLNSNDKEIKLNDRELNLNDEESKMNDEELNLNDKKDVKENLNSLNEIDEIKIDQQVETDKNMMQHILKRHQELESDSDEEDFSFVNQFKFKKNCKIEESDDEDETLTFKNKLTSGDDNKLSPLNDIYDNLNSQDSQFQNNRESTFLESKSDGKKNRFNMKDFIEDQAELSEEDKEKFSSDEEEDSNDEYEQEVIDENLPSDEEILKANNKIFMKQQMDEDRREILEYQERFLEFGDLHNNGEARQRQFKWKNVDNVWLDNLKDSSDSDEFDIEDSQIEYTSLHLKQLDAMDKTNFQNEASNKESQQSNDAATQSSVNLNEDEKRKKKLMNTSLNKTHLSSYSTFDNSIFNKHMRTFKRNTVNGPANDIQSYIIKDKNLVNAMSLKSSVVAVNKEKGKQLSRNENVIINAKKRKIDKNENKKSIFDLF